MKKYSIYQINDEAANSRYVKYATYELVQELGVKLSLDMYKKVYDGEVEVEDNETTYETLEGLFMKFQGRKPEGYTGHSLSVSDVILMDGIYYYVDGTGFQEVMLPKQKKAVYTILIFNEKSMKRERKNFGTQEEADAFYENKKSKVTPLFPPKEKWFSYRNDWGNTIMVQKMY